MNAEILILSAGLNYFIFFLLNGRHQIGEYLRFYHILDLPEKVRYALGCSFCFGFWAGLGHFLIACLNSQPFDPLYVPLFAVLNMGLSRYLGPTETE
jgi:hypothetical protein